MKRHLLVAVLMMTTIALPVFAQDHSEHRSSPPPQPTETPDKPTSPTTEDHSQHSTPSASEAAKDESRESELRHIPPDPPEHAMADMSEERMMELMEMDDTSKAGKVLLDELEGYRADDSTALAWDAQAWYGDDYNKLWAKTEGESTAGETAGRAELLWDRIFARWWSVQTGVRHDFGEGPARTWGAIGVEGLAPYWFDIEATLYVGEGGRAAARLKSEYELLFTQRLILQPEVEINLYSEDDRERNIGAGLSDFDFGLRLRYEIRREIAPYIGVRFTQRFCDTADMYREAGHDSGELRAVAGLRVWF